MQQQNVHLKNPSDKEYKVWKRTRFFSEFKWFQRIQHWPWQPPPPWKGHHHYAHSLARTPDFTLPGTGHSPTKKKELDVHFLLPSPPLSLTTISSPLSASPNSLSHPTLQASLCLCPFPLPCLLSELCFGCFHAPHSLFSDSGYWLLQWPLPTLPTAATATCTDVHAWAASPRPCLALPPTCPSPTCFSSG